MITPVFQAETNTNIRQCQAEGIAAAKQFNIAQVAFLCRCRAEKYLTVI